MNLRLGITGYVLCAIVFILGTMSLRSNVSSILEEADRNLESGRALVVDGNLEADSLTQFLLEGGYLTDKKDAKLVGEWICGLAKETGELDNLGQLNSPAFKIPADTALRYGGKLMHTRVNADYLRMGIDDEWENRNQDAGSDFSYGKETDGLITVRITNGKSAEGEALNGIPVRIRQHSYKRTASDGATEQVDSTTELVSETLGFATTDASGTARFHVKKGGSYSVLPILPGFQYGREKGTSDGELTEPLSLSFKQSRHVLTPLDNSTYQMLKSDHALMVRTPADWTESLLLATLIYLIGWAALFAVTAVRDRLMETHSDYLFLTIVMALTGIGLLAAFGMTNPLSDKPNGFSTATALGVGLLAMGAVSCINFAKFYNGKSRIQMGVIPFDAVDSLITSRLRRSKGLDKRNVFSISSGFMYLMFALLLIALLALFGTGPEGSDARVNLGSFQPSELSKYLIIIFIAAFFAENAMLLQEFSQKLTRITWRRQLGTVAIVMLIMFALMCIYLLVLSDMGPALVLLITFIFIYSMARRDFGHLLLGFVTFVAMMLGAYWLGAGLLALMTVALMWLTGWFLYGWYSKRQIYESAIFLNLLIVAFALGGYILQAAGAESEAARLLNRTSMAWSGVWDNHVTGGDQVAQGLWSLASGGLTGLGLGGGNPSLVPACHTDMAFTSIGEMLGLTGLVLVILCFVALVHRALLIGRKAAQPFVMYLVMGIAIVTGVQFLFIVLGSLGLIPLTGISVPLLSYGKTGLIITLAMLGIVVSASRTKATDSQRKYAATYDGAIAAGALLFIAGGLVIVAALLKYQVVERNSTLIRGAHITNTMGARIIEYNPRINLILGKMESGSIYDRNGLLLATSSREELLKNIDQLVEAGLDRNKLNEEANKRKKRYYPFGNETLFMIGDANTKKVYSYYVDNPIGYLAEYRHFSALRGIDFPTKKVELHSDEYRENRFMPKISTSFNRTEYDYSPILPFLDYGSENNPKVKSYNNDRPGRDMQLTIDAALQTKLQHAIAKGVDKTEALKKLDKLRISVVVLDAANGDLLCSANYPEAEQDTIVMLNEMRIFGDVPGEAIKGHTPITERDLGTTFFTMPGSTAKVMSGMAGLMGLGADAANQSYYIYDFQQVHKSASTLGNVDMLKAIRNSSNVYFVNLINDHKLYPQLETLYNAVGARVTHDINQPVRMANSYYFFPDEMDNSKEFHSIINDIASESYDTYDKIYMRELEEGRPVKWRTNRKWTVWHTGMAWGQGGLRATPLTMARVAATVANGGKLAPTRYVLKQGKTDTELAEPIELLKPAEASAMEKMMIAEAGAHHQMNRYNNSTTLKIGGKTGTPERGARGTTSKYNDAWYMFFVKPNGGGMPIAVAIRIERTMGRLSDLALETVRDIVLPVLEETGYTNP